VKKILFKCDWCPQEERIDSGQPDGWIERKGTKPEEVRDEKANTKEYLPHQQTLQFCGDACNQVAKRAEADCLKAANAAWIRVYNERKA